MILSINVFLKACVRLPSSSTGQLILLYGFCAGKDILSVWSFLLQHIHTAITATTTGLAKSHV
jgi:hypothetical protein